MVMSESEWNSLNNSLPPEDQMSYAEYLSYAQPAEPVATTEPTYSFTDYWSNSGDYWLAMGDKYAADATAATAAIPPYFPPPYFSFLWGGAPQPQTKVCPEGYVLDASGNCVKVAPPYFPPPYFPPPYFPTYVTPYVPPYVSPYVPPYTPRYVAPYVPPTPPPPPPPPVVIPAPPVKSGTPQYVMFDEELVPSEMMIDLLFEDIGGEELLTIARSDTVNGQDVLYQPFKNLGILSEQYNPNNIIKLQQTSEIFFSNFPIQLNTRIPNYGNGPNGSTVYLNTEELNEINRTNIEVGALVLDFINLGTDEQVEVQISINGTIYESGV